MEERGWNGLPKFSKALYNETYFLPDEDYDQLIDRICTAYSNDTAHKNRMISYFKNYWMHTSTPPTSNAGTNRGLPISCFTRDISDSKTGIFMAYNEAFWLGARGGGIGSNWSHVRSVNEPVGKHGGTSSGVVPFLGISDRATLAVSQGGLRRASEAVYMHISHPEIKEFIDIRKPTGNQNRRTPNLHHGVVIPDSFMQAVIKDDKWDLISPKTSEVIETVNAKDLWEQLLNIRVTMKGEPYLLFIDTVNKMAPDEYKAEGVVVDTSNLCTEITLRTDDNHAGVCCLASVNAEYFDEWKSHETFIPDCCDFLDNILQDFIDQVEAIEDPMEKQGFARALAGAKDERSIGLGVMGLHSLFQKHMLPFDSMAAKYLNKQVFKHIKEQADAHNIAVNKPCPMALRTGSKKRNIHVTAVAPTMSISSLCNVTSSGIEPWVTNAFTKKVTQGSFPIRNKYLNQYIDSYADANELDSKWIEQQWQSIKKENGSVQHLEWMPQVDKDVFKTAFEIDQRWIIQQAADRQPYIDQAQSVNIFIPGDSDVQMIADLHMMAWALGVKSLYYLRSTAVNRASTSDNERKQIKGSEITIDELTSDTCVGCA